MPSFPVRSFHSVVLLLAAGILSSLSLRGIPAQHTPSHSADASRLPWQAPARLHHGLRTKRGNLVFSTTGIDFRAADMRFSHRWPYAEVKTFYITPRCLTITTYANPRFHLPGDRRYRFDVSRRIPPGVAARLSELVGKPAINADPGPGSQGFAAIPARHRTLTGGTNGVLRFSDHGIAYVTTRGQGGRSWRWADIETIANPDLYHFKVSAYRETFEFELKQPMSSALFDRLWDFVYGRGLQLGARSGQREDTSGIAGAGADQQR